jgi:hypothetical protein
MLHCCGLFQGYPTFKSCYQKFHIPSLSKMNPATCVHVHKCPPIPLEDFELGRLKPLSWSREAISAAIIANLERSLVVTQFGRSRNAEPDKYLLSKRQKDAVERFNYQGSWNLAQPDNLEDLNKFFNLFDDAYFGGLLKGYCRLETISSSDSTQRRFGGHWDGTCQPYWPGEERDSRYALDKPFIVLTMRRHEDDRFESIKNHLEVLLHEMVHAIFDIYTCRCQNGCKQRHAREGGGGHWVEWQAAAKSIEMADRKNSHLLRFGLDLRREQSFVTDVQMGLNIPAPAQLWNAGLNIVEVRRDLVWARVQKVREEKEKRPTLKQLKANVCLLHYRKRDFSERSRFYIDFPTLFEPTIPW